MRKFLLTCTTFLAAATALATPALAQAPTDPTISSADIVVTARKREERLFDVPNAVTAIAGAQVSDLRLQDARDLITLTPNAFLQENNAGTARDISIRGISTPSLFAEPGVALYVDEVYSSGFISFPTRFYDLERVEVLRGPQGGLYGRNAVGGAVNVISKRPTDEFGASASVTRASNERSEVEATVNAPIGASAGVRLSGWYVDQEEGDYFNPTTKKYLDATDDLGGRIVFNARPTDKINITLIAETTGGALPGTYLYFPTAGETKSTVTRDTQPSNEFDSTRYGGEFSLDTEVGDFTLVVGKRDYSLDGVEDTDLSTSVVFDPGAGQLGQQSLTRTNESDGKSAELRWLSKELGPVTLLAGLSYLDESATGDLLTKFVTGSAIFGVPVELGILNDQEVTSYAGFVEATIALSDALSLIGSVRYTEDEKSVDFRFAPTPALGGFGLFPQSLKRTKTFENVSPGVTLAWSPNDDLRVYGKVQTGFRAGGFNFNVGSVANLPYDEETSVNYEVGAKKRLADGRASLGGNIFYLTQKDVLSPLFDFAQPPGLQGYLDNIGEAETLGVELEGTVQVSDALTVSASAGWLNAEYTSGSVNGASVDGKTLPSARDWTYAVTASYRQPVSGNITALLDGSYTYRSDGFQDAANRFKISDATLLNASAGLAFGPAELRAFVQNALDDDYEIAFGGFRPPNESGVIRAPERIYGVTLRLAY